MVVPRGERHGRDVVVGVAESNPARASEGRALVEVKKEPGTAKRPKTPCGHQGQLSNWSRKVKRLRTSAWRCWLAGKSDRSGRPGPLWRSLEKESASASSKVGGALNRLCLGFTCFFFLGRLRGGLIDSDL